MDDFDADNISEDKLDAFIYEKGPYYDDDLITKEEEKEKMQTGPIAAFAAAAEDSAKEIAMLRMEIEKLKAAGTPAAEGGFHCWGCGAPGVIQRNCKECNKKKNMNKKKNKKKSKNKNKNKNKNENKNNNTTRHLSHTH